MDETQLAEIREWAVQIQQYTPISWDRMPELQLYMDQVIAFMEKQLDFYRRNAQSKTLTPSMINNYVKMKLIPAPVKKRYGVRQLARLVVICTLKRDFSIAELSTMMQTVLAKYENVEAYNRFCAEMEMTIRSVFRHEEIPAAGACMEDQIIRAVMMAFANKLLAHCTIREYTMAAPGDGDVSAEQA